MKALLFAAAWTTVVVVVWSADSRSANGTRVVTTQYLGEFVNPQSSGRFWTLNLRQLDGRQCVTTAVGTAPRDIGPLWDVGFASDGAFYLAGAAVVVKWEPVANVTTSWTMPVSAARWAACAARPLAFCATGAAFPPSKGSSTVWNLDLESHAMRQLLGGFPAEHPCGVHVDDACTTLYVNNCTSILFYNITDDGGTTLVATVNDVPGQHGCGVGAAADGIFCIGPPGAANVTQVLPTGVAATFYFFDSLDPDSPVLGVNVDSAAGNLLLEGVFVSEIREVVKVLVVPFRGTNHSGHFLGGATCTQNPQVVSSSFLLSTRCNACSPGAGATCSPFVSTPCVQCDAGYISPGGVGHACTACPAGTTSTAGNTACGACPRFTASTVGSACAHCPAGTSNVASGSTRCYACPIPAACLPTGGCAAGSGGLLCGTCSAGYYQLFGGCRRCPASGPWWSVGVGVVLLVTVLVLVDIGVLSEERLRMPEQLVYHVQVVMVVFGFRVRWPAWLLRACKWVESLPIISHIALWSPECLLHRSGGFYIMLGLKMAAAAAAFGLLAALRWYAGRKAKRSATALSVDITVANKWYMRHLRLSQLLVVLGLMAYLPVVRMLLQALPCLSTPQGRRLVADVEVLCSSSLYISTAVTSGLAVGALVVVLPGVLVWRLRALGSVQGLRTHREGMLLATLHAPYKGEGWAPLAALVSLEYRLLSEVAKTALSSSGVAQSAVQLILGAAALAYQLHVHPWRRVDLDPCFGCCCGRCKADGPGTRGRFVLADAMNRLNVVKLASHMVVSALGLGTLGGGALAVGLGAVAAVVAGGVSLVLAAYSLQKRLGKVRKMLGSNTKTEGGVLSPLVSGEAGAGGAGDGGYGSCQGTGSDGGTSGGQGRVTGKVARETLETAEYVRLSGLAEAERRAKQQRLGALQGQEEALRVAIESGNVDPLGGSSKLEDVRRAYKDMQAALVEPAGGAQLEEVRRVHDERVRGEMTEWQELFARRVSEWRLPLYDESGVMVGMHQTYAPYQAALEELHDRLADGSWWQLALAVREHLNYVNGKLAVALSRRKPTFVASMLEQLGEWRHQSELRAVLEKADQETALTELQETGEREKADTALRSATSHAEERSKLYQRCKQMASKALRRLIKNGALTAAVLTSRTAMNLIRGLDCEVHESAKLEPRLEAVVKAGRQARVLLASPSAEDRKRGESGWASAQEQLRQAHSHYMFEAKLSTRRRAYTRARGALALALRARSTAL